MTDLAKMKQDEWLEADGLGGFASGTVSGIRPRRYHALLLAASRRRQSAARELAQSFPRPDRKGSPLTGRTVIPWPQ
jgi:hypothetical protein